MADDSSVELFSTPKMNMDGDGDGIKNVTARKRTPVPSSRKFNARTPCDEKIKIKLEKALTEMQAKDGKPKSHCCLSKSQSVAEITPTKSKPRKKPSLKLENFNLSFNSLEHDASHFDVTLHATPRPLDGLLVATTTASRRCTRDWAACKVYGRLLLSVWRRSKARLQALSENNGRQQNQISQLELQVDFLKNMRNSECDKRNEALNDCLRMKKKVEVLELENNNLIEEIKSLQEELINTKKSIKLVKHDLKKSSEQLIKTQDLLKKRKEEKLDLLTKLSTQEQEIYSQNTTITDLEEALKTAERNLHNIESNYKTKQDEFDEVYQQLETETKLNATLRNEVSSLQKAKVHMESRSKHLEDELETYISHIEDLKEENTSVRNGLEMLSLELSAEKKRAWYKNTEGLALLSLSVLQKIAEVVLPVYHKY